MAVTRQHNILGQQRLDVPHLRAIESAIAADFDLLAGGIMAGSTPLILAGFRVISTGIVAASRLRIEMDGGVLIHPTASEAGGMYRPADGAADETLANTNAAVRGSWTPSAVNYVGIDLVRAADTTTTDLTAFYDESTETETYRRVPQGRTLTHRIQISTLDFALTPNVAPIAKVTTDASNNVVSVEDARAMFFRLGTGGGAPDGLNTFAWPAGRVESTTFDGGDKNVASLKAWSDAVMTRMWELGGGEHWFSSTADRNVKMVAQGATFVSTYEYFEWVANNLHWKNISLVFDNSTASYNDIADQTADSPGLTDLADGECLYVDVDRTTNRTGATALTPAKAPLATLGLSTTPGARFVIAWRKGANVFVKDQQLPVGDAAPNAPATTLSLGAVMLSGTPADATQPRCATLNASGVAACAGVTRAGGVLVGGAISIGTDVLDTSVAYGHAACTTHVMDAAANNGTVDTLKVRNNTEVGGNTNTVVARFQQQDTTLKDVFKVEGNGALQMILSLATVGTPATGFAKLVLRTNGVATPNTRMQFGIQWPAAAGGLFTVIAESDLY